MGECMGKGRGRGWFPLSIILLSMRVIFPEDIARGQEGKPVASGVVCLFCLKEKPTMHCIYVVENWQGQFFFSSLFLALARSQVE